MDSASSGEAGGGSAESCSNCLMAPCVITMLLITAVASAAQAA